MNRATRSLAFVPIVVAATAALAGIDAEVGNGDKITGTLSPASEVETFRVRVPAGAKILVKAKAAKKGPSLHVVLLPPLAAVLGTADGAAPSISAEAPMSGLYAVSVESQDGTTPGDYSLTISWKSRTTFTKTATLAPNQSDTLEFAADRGATATIAAKRAKSSAAVAALDQLTLPDSSVVAIAAQPAKVSLALPGRYEAAFRNSGAAAGGVTATVKLKLPKTTKRKLNLTSKAIGSGNALGDAAVAALFGADGGTLTVPFIAPGVPGAEISGSAVSVPKGALGATTTLVIATAPPLGVPDASLDSAGPTVLFGPQGLKFDALDKTATATVTIPYDASFDSTTDTFVVYTRDAKGKITAVAKPYTFDHAAHTVSFATSHFSSFRAGGTASQSVFTLNTLVSLVDPRDVCAAHDASAGLPIRYYVANGIGTSVVALRTGQPPGPLVTSELYVGGGTDPIPGTPRLLFSFSDPVQSVDTTPSGVLWMATTTQVFVLDAAGNVQLVAGTGQTGDGGDNGPATNATFTDIRSILVTLTGQIYVCDAGAHRIRLIDTIANNTISAWAGTGLAAVGADGVNILTTTFVGPTDMAFDGTGPGLYVTDGGRVRHLAPTPAAGGNGINVTVAGDAGGATGSTGDGGAPASARFMDLKGIALYPDPHRPNDTVLLVTDRLDHTIRRIDLTTNAVDLVAGQHGTLGFGGDLDVSTGLIDGPLQLITEANDVTFVDGGNGRIRVQTLLQ